MATVAVLQTDLILNSAAFRTGMAQAAATANSTLGSIRDQAASTASSLSLLSKAAVGLFAFDKIKEGVGALVEAQVELQQIHYTLVTATGSASAADTAFGELRETSAKLGLNLQPAAQAFGQLAASAQASGISMGATKQLFEAFGEASTTLHLSAEQSNHALLALTEMMSAGTIHARQLNQQLGFAIPGSAARFKAAVMDAVKGTDLQGQSFMHLMADGKLVTSQFLPQLTQALRESGRGWQEAAGGLNAQLNRLKTSWFDLKTEVSGGLFNDVATNGIAFAASNLERMAAAATVLAGIGVARLLGTGAQRATSAVVSPITRYRQETVGAQQAAAAEREYASSLVATARAESELAVSDARLQEQRKTAALQELEARQGAIFTAQAQRDVSTANLERLRSAALLSANLRQMELEEARLAKAMADEALQSQMAAGALKRYQEAVQLSAAADARLVAANEAVAASAAQVAAANEASALAAGEAGLAGAFAKAGASLGSFALSLVGGPWGAAALAIGAIGYAIYDVYEQGVKWEEQTKNDVKSLEQVTQSAKDAADAYGQLGSAMTAVQALDTLKGVNQEVSKEQDAIKSLQDRLADAKKDFENATANSDSAELFFSQRRIDELTSRITELQGKLPQAEQAAQGLSSKLSGVLTPAVDGLKNAVAALRSGGSITDAINALASQSDIDKAAQGVVKAQQAANSAMEEIDSLAASAHKKSLTKGQSYLDQAEAAAKIAVENIKKEHLTAADEAKAISDVQDELAKKKADLVSGNAFENARNAATAAREQQQAYQSLIATIQTRIDQDKEATGQEAKLTAAQALRDKVLNDLSKSTSKLSAAQKDHIKAMLEEAVAAGAARKTSEEQIAADRNMLNLKRQLADEAERQARANAAAVAGVGHGSEWNAEQRALDQIAQAYQKRKEEADRAFKDETRGEQASKVQLKEHADAIALLDVEFAKATAAQKKFYEDSRAAQANWSNGFRAGIEDFLTAQQNNAARAKQMVADLTSGFSSAFADFVSGAKSAKDAFGSLIDDMYKKALQFVADKAIQAVFDSFSSLGGGGAQSTPGSTAGGWGSLIGNVINAFSSGNSGGLASGGYAAAGSVHQVAENGPELLRVGSRTMLLMGDQGGQVVPNQQIGNGGGTTVYSTTINVQPTSTRRTADQIATATARKQRAAATRNA